MPPAQKLFSPRCTKTGTYRSLSHIYWYVNSFFNLRRLTAEFFVQEVNNMMNEHSTPILNLPPRPAPRDDLDDLIFREEGWLVSDR